MIELLVALFLAAHGLVHLAVYLVPAPARGNGPPFDPAHSWALAAAHVGHDSEVAVARALAVTAALGMSLAALGVLIGAPWAAAMAAAAAVMGLVLKGLYFNPWLLIGIAVDLLIVAVALTPA